MSIEQVTGLLPHEVENVVYLPIGVKYQGSLIRKIEIKEPDGFTEEKQTDPKYRKLFNTIITATVADCIVSAEGLKLPTKPKEAFETKFDLVSNMLETDRQYLLTQIYRNTYGDIFELRCTCPECQTRQTRDINLSTDLRIVGLDENRDESLDLSVVSGVNLTTPIVVKGESFSEISIRMPHVSTITALERKGDNLGDVKTTLLLQTLAVNHPRFTISETDVKRWTTRIRDSVMKDISEHRIGYINEVNHICESCGETFKAQIPLNEMLGK